jgi:hypothetical protein
MPPARLAKRAAPVIAAAGKQAHMIADTANLQPVAVMLDFVHSAGTRRRLHGARGNAERNETGREVIPVFYRRHSPWSNGHLPLMARTRPDYPAVDQHDNNSPYGHERKP